MEPIPPSGYPESADSSPRSRGGDSWDEGYPAPSPAAAARIRLMCSFGGRIVPRPTDKSLCYLGGETRIVAVDRHASLADVKARLARSLLGGRPFALKYQLPNEDLDSLISVSTDEDFDNLVDEYDRLVAAGSKSRIRVFLFPSASPSSAASSIGSLLDDTSKSETWFVDALNSAIAAGGSAGGSLDGNNSTSVNCLLGLEDDSSVHAKMIPQVVGPGAVGDRDRAAPPRQDVQSVPDSPMMDKTSSFGSTSSAPSLANLPPIRVRPDDRGMEEQFGHIAVSEMQAPAPPVVVPPAVVVQVAAAAVESGGGGPGVRGFPDDDDKSDLAAADRRMQQLAVDSAAAAAIANRLNDWSPTAEATKREVLVPADGAGNRITVPVTDASYVYAIHHPAQQQQQQQLPAVHQPQQFIPAGSGHYLHTGGGTFLQVPSYYHQQVTQQQQQHGHPSVPAMYYVPMHQNHPGQPYNIATAMAAPPPNLVDVAKPSIPIAIPQSATSAQASMFRGISTPAAIPASAPAAAAFANLGYHVMPHHHPSQAPPGTAISGFSYDHFADPSRSIPTASPQVYYSQANPPPPSLPSQFHPGMFDMAQPDSKAHRAS